MQTFDSIQISDKGMVKLIRSMGKDFIFPASRIASYSMKWYEETQTGDYAVIINLITSIFSSEPKPVHHYVTLIIDGEEFVVDKVDPGIAPRLDVAIKKSKEIDRKRYGEFK